LEWQSFISWCFDSIVRSQINLKFSMFDIVQKFLRRTNSSLTDLQSIDLTLYAAESPEAVRIFQRFLDAADEGDPYAIAMCASCYRSGWGTKINADKAFLWAQSAARTGFAPGLAELGYCYEEGLGTEVDLTLALKNLSRAAEAGYGMPALNLAFRYASGTPYGESKDEAIRYANMALEAGEPYAAYLPGTWYEEGKIVPKNELTARAWYEKAAELGSQLACMRMAAAHTNGEFGLMRDPVKAKELLKLAESSDSP
jgi:TPR repeat protein